MFLKNNDFNKVDGHSATETEFSSICTNADSLLNKQKELELFVDDTKQHVIGITHVKHENYRYPLQEAEISLYGYNCFMSLDGGRDVALLVNN